MQERVFNYGPKTWHLAFSIIANLLFLASSGYFLARAAVASIVDGISGEPWVYVVYGLFVSAGLYGLVTSVLRIRHASQRRRNALKITEFGIQVGWNGSRNEVEVVPFRDITKTKVATGGNDGTEFVVTHAAGKLRLNKDNFDNGDSFEQCAATIAARSGTELQWGWLTGGPSFS